MVKTTITKIRKRDGRIVKFNPKKIVNAIYKAAQAVGGNDRKRAEWLADKVIAKLETKYGNCFFSLKNFSPQFFR